MLDLRVYRVAWLPAIVVVAVMAFSLVSVPEGIRSRLAPSGFDGGRVATTANELADLAPQREPGSAGDERVAQFVRRQFTGIEGGQVTEQQFTGDFKGDSVQMRNVVLVLPGQSDRRVVLIAHRDSGQGEGRASSAAATATLLEIAANFSGSTHNKTLVFVSTDGGDAGAAGARTFAANYPGNEAVDAMIVLEQPAARNPRRPFVVGTSTGRQSPSIQMMESARAAVRDEVGATPGSLDTFGQIVQLALPSGLGEQSVLIPLRFNSVAISSGGEPPLPPEQDGFGSISPDTLGEFGRATLTLMLAMDTETASLEHGPSAYVPFADNLLPAWTLRVLALALILPVAAAAVDGIARVRRRGHPVLRQIGWVAGRAAPFVALVLMLYLLAFVGVLPSPEFPFNADLYGLGLTAKIGLAVAAVTFGVVGYLGRLLLVPRQPPFETLAVALAVVMAGTMLAVWLVNPFLALLLVPTLHIWQVPALPRLRGGLALALGFLFAGMLVPALAIGELAARLRLGTGVLSFLLLQVTGGQIGALQMLLLCVFAGCAVAMVAIAMTRRAELKAAAPPPPPPENPFGLEPVD
jgi:peptidase M28-like protein